MSPASRRWLLWGALSAAIAWLAGAGSFIDWLRGMRPPTEAESFYGYIAQQLAEPSLCDKISWTAESPGGFFIPPSYERSECYSHIASATRDLLLCWKVRRLGPVSLWDGQLTSWSCLRRARAGSHVASGVSDETMLSFFKAMGYDVDTLHLEGVTPPVILVQDVYRAAVIAPDAARRVDAAHRAAPANRIDVEDDAYLLDLVAMARKDPGSCMRIPEELVLEAEAKRFRDWCVFKLASDTRNARTCRTIPIRPDEVARNRDLAPATAAQMTLQAQCESQAGASDTTGFYGPQMPADEARMRRLLALLGVEIPKAHDLPAARVAEAYRTFVYALSDPRVPNRQPARQRLVDRVQRLELQ